MIMLGCAGAGSEHRASEHPATVDASPVAVSLLGKPLFATPIEPARRAELEANLDAARAALAAQPDDPENVIWVGRRLAYLGRYRDAIDMYTAGIESWPEYPKLYRHRGHRWITLRELDRAVADLERAASLIQEVPDEVEPDGAPNPYGIPRSTSHSNIWYHLGLAYYLQGSFEAALRAYRECLRFSTNDDMLCATTDWLYMTCRRLGRDAEARAALEPIHARMEILENRAYHRRLLMYKGELPADSLLQSRGASDLDLATQGYGVGNWFLCNGDTVRAKEIFTRVLENPMWAAFGTIAAEADLARLR
jgi:tetratricopeptide (TPR) repeat protein